MFDWIADKIQAVKDFFAWAWQSCWDTACGWLTSAWAVLTVVIGWVYWAFDTIAAAIVVVVSKVDAIVFPNLSASGAGLSYYLSVGNTFFPLQELFAFVVSYFALLVALNLYRLVKSWIPTLS